MNEPCVFEGFMAELAWDPERVAQSVGAEQTFEVAYGVEENSGATLKCHMSMPQFVDQLVAADLELKTQGGKPDAQRLLYLKQDSEVLNRCPGLWDDIQRVCTLLRGQYRTPFFWMGGEGCVTGLHSDDEHNVLLQIWGKKSVLLFAPDLVHRLYPNTKYDSGTVCCDLDPLCPDFERHPLAREVFEGRQYQRAELQPGDVLYCPRGWFHHVAAESASISVNVFASSIGEWLWWGVPRKVLEIAHQVGLIGRGNCVCHASSIIEQSKL